MDSRFPRNISFFGASCNIMIYYDILCNMLHFYIKNMLKLVLRFVPTSLRLSSHDTTAGPGADLSGLAFRWPTATTRSAKAMACGSVVQSAHVPIYEQLLACSKWVTMGDKDESERSGVRFWHVLTEMCWSPPLRCCSVANSLLSKVLSWPGHQARWLESFAPESESFRSLGIKYTGRLLTELNLTDRRNKNPDMEQTGKKDQAANKIDKDFLNWISQLILFDSTGLNAKWEVSKLRKFGRRDQDLAESARQLLAEERAQLLQQDLRRVAVSKTKRHHFVARILELAARTGASSVSWFDTEGSVDSVGQVHWGFHLQSELREAQETGKDAFALRLQLVTCNLQQSINKVELKLYMKTYENIWKYMCMCNNQSQSFTNSPWQSMSNVCRFRFRSWMASVSGVRRNLNPWVSSCTSARSCGGDPLALELLDPPREVAPVGKRFGDGQVLPVPKAHLVAVRLSNDRLNHRRRDAEFRAWEPYGKKSEKSLGKKVGGNMGEMEWNEKQRGLKNIEKTWWNETSAVQDCSYRGCAAEPHPRCWPADAGSSAHN